MPENVKRPMFRWLLAVLLGTTAVFAAAPAGEKPSAGQLVLVAECEGGRLYQCGNQRVLMVWGSPYQMGRAHGTLLAKEARTLIQRVLRFCVLSDVARKKGLFAGSIGQAYQRTRPFIPERYQEEMRGLSEGACLPLGQVQLASVFPELFHCSGFALFGKATQDGRLLHGRILDYLTNLGLQDYAVTIVARPEGQNAFVNVGYAGFIGSVTGMNEKGVAIGQIGGRGGENDWDGVPMAFLFRRALEEADTLDEAVAVIRDAPRTCEYYYVISDGKIPDARGLYCTAKECVVLRPGEAHPPMLPDAVEDGVVFSAGERLRVLLERIRAQYGRLTSETAIRLMDRPVAMEPNLKNVLFAPQSFELWVANAASPGRANYQACFQPYQYYNLAALLKQAADASARQNVQPAGKETKPAD